MPIARSRYWQSLRDLEDPSLPNALDLYAPASLLPSGGGARRADEGSASHADSSSQQGTAFPSSGAARHLPPEGEGKAADRTLITLRQRYNDAIQSLSSDALKLLRDWPQRLKSITDEVTEYEVRGKAIKVENYRDLAQPPEDSEDRRADL